MLLRHGAAKAGGLDLLQNIAQGFRRSDAAFSSNPELRPSALIRELTVSHILEVLDDTVLHRLGDLQVVAELCGLITNHKILDGACCCIALLYTQDGPPDDGRKDMLREIGACLGMPGESRETKDGSVERKRAHCVRPSSMY